MDGKDRAGMTPAGVAALVAGTTMGSSAAKMFAAGTFRTAVSLAEALE